MVKRPDRYLLTGLITVIPILVTIFVVSVFVDLLSNIGRPKVLLIAKTVHPLSPDLARSMIEVPWLQTLLAILLTLAMFYVLGWAVSRLVGRRILHAVEALVQRIPLVTTIYGASKQMIDAFKTSGPDEPQRVVLLEFPREGMKAVGFVTRQLTDTADGTELAAVYVPTAPNPTGGYLVIVPVRELIPLDWSVDEAITFVVAAGATAPPSVSWRGASATPPAQSLKPLSETAPEVTHAQ